MKTSIAIAGAVGLLAAATATAQTFTFPLDPKASYLRTNNDVSAAPLVLNLASLGIAPGQWLRIGTTGFYRSIAGGPDTYRSLAGVFSSSTTLLPETDQFRVVDAIAAGPAVQSGPTFVGSLPIDIPEDFDCSRLGWASSMDVMVPANATHLFLGTHESFFSDNVDPNGDFAAVVTLLAPPTMPGTGEHLVLKSAVGGAPALTPDVHLEPASEIMGRNASSSWPIAAICCSTALSTERVSSTVVARTCWPRRPRVSLMSLRISPSAVRLGIVLSFASLSSRDRFELAMKPAMLLTTLTPARAARPAMTVVRTESVFKAICSNFDVEIGRASCRERVSSPV